MTPADLGRSVAGVNLAVTLTECAGRLGDEPALRLDGREISYRALDAASARVAALLLARGVGPGDRVGLMLPNVPQFPSVYYGILRAGAIVVPLNPLLKRREVSFYLEDSGTRLLFAWHACAEAAEAGAKRSGTACLFVAPAEFERLLRGSRPEARVRERRADDTAVILYTSGTTGTPKGAELTHANLERNRAAVCDLHSLDREDVVLGALPLYHSFGQTCSMNATIAAGGCLTLIPRFDPGLALRVIERDRVTIFQGVPTMYAAMLAHPERGSFDVSGL
ncbi:MAG: AMP-binding protein, partial [Solirubrobacterales bacterium]|nr:AMP-binding protein [Solirubrobacterales bacterium]